MTLGRCWMCVALPATLILVAGCSTRTVLRPTARPETSYRQITPPDAPHYALRPGQTASLPTPEIGYFAPPTYPAAWVKPGAPTAVLKAQLAFGVKGRVTAVYFLDGSYAGPGRAAFEAAVRSAVDGWRFTPLVFESWSDPGRAAGTLARKAKPFSLWLEFRFAVVDGQPVVQTLKR